MPCEHPSETAAAQALIEQSLQDCFEQHRETFNFGETFDPLYFDMAEFVGRKGKRIRPRLVLAAYKALGGERPLTDPDLIQAASATELLHAFILIHDDVIDRSDMRRGLPTYHRLVGQRIKNLHDSERTGQNVAIVMGDILFSLAIDTLNTCGFPPPVRQAAMSRFLRYIMRTGAGEVFDVLLGVRDIGRVSREDILRTYHLKTTCYTFEAPSVIGATLAGASPEKIDALARAMDPLGLAFQIQNDLIEFSHFDPSDTLMQRDLLEGKKTLLLFEAYDSLGDVEQSFLQMCLGTQLHTEGTILRLRNLVEKSGAVQRLETRVAELFAEAETILCSDPFTGEETSALLATLASIRGQLRRVAQQ